MFKLLFWLFPVINKEISFYLQLACSLPETLWLCAKCYCFGGKNQYIERTLCKEKIMSGIITSLKQNTAALLLRIGNTPALCASNKESNRVLNSNCLHVFAILLKSTFNRPVKAWGYAASRHLRTPTDHWIKTFYYWSYFALVLWI